MAQDKQNWEVDLEAGIVEEFIRKVTEHVAEAAEADALHARLCDAYEGMPELMGVEEDVTPDQPQAGL
jgi:hypothetical protein